MMDHETRPRISLLDRLVKAIRPRPMSATGSPDMVEPAMHAAMGEGGSGMMAGAPSMSAHAPVDAPSMDAPPMAESAMESSAMDDPAPTDGPMMG